MANQFNKEEIVLFERVLEKFETDNRVAMQAASFSQGAQEMQNSGDTVWRPQAMISTTVDGLDVTSSIGSITQLSVPASLTTIKSVTWEADAKQMRDRRYRDRKADSAAQALAAAINRAMASTAAIYGSLTVQVVGALTGYDDISLADALMDENDVKGPKTMVLNSRDYNVMAGNLASRTLMPRSENALSDGNLGDVANFSTWKTSFTPTLALAGAGAVTVTGTQRYVPVSTSTASTGEESNVDNRTMELTVNSTALKKAGDKFTIANVNSLSHINKADTGQLKTFSVVSVVNATTLQIAPPIIVGDGTSDAEDDYANVTAAAIGAASLTFLNTATVRTNVFFIDDSIEIFNGNLAFDEDMAGVSVLRMTTDSGVEIIFAKEGNAKTGKAFYRLTIFFGTTNLNPEMNGILIGNQV